MRIGFYMKWPRGSLGWAGNVIGDELYAESLASALRRRPGVTSAELYAPNRLPPAGGLDVLVHLNDEPPRRDWARRHVLYLQNTYGGGSDRALARFQGWGFDGYAFISNRLLEIHRASGRDGIFLPFGVDTDLFRPVEHSPRHAFEVAYVGNDIKGAERTRRYLLPALHYRFGLYGTWEVPNLRWKFWKRWTRYPEYRRQLATKALGKIPQEEVPVLYGSAAINLNCTSQDCVDWDVITLRTYEVLACRGFLVTDRVPVAEQLLDGCVVFTDGGGDLVEKIDHYLAHPEERRAIAERGYRHVLAHATVGARADELLAYLRSIA